MPTNIVDVSTFETTIVAPADADPLNAASIVPNGLQRLANRTRNLADRLGGPTGNAEWAYENAPRTRLVLVSMDQLGQSTGNSASQSNWFANTVAPGHILESIVDRAALILDLNKYLPDGGTLTRVRALVTPGAARPAQTTNPGDGGRMYASLYRQTPLFSSPSTSFSGPIAGDEDDGTTTMQVLDTGVISEVINKASNILYWHLRATDTAGTASCSAIAVEITYSDPGPRSF